MADISKATASLELSNQDQKPKYALYKVCVTCNGKNWFIFRRYSEFTNLQDKIKSQFPGLPKLPGKRLFGGNDAKFLEKRREGLDNFVMALLANDRVTKHPLVREFFCLDQKLAEAETEEKDTPEEESEANDDEIVDLGSSENTKARPSDFNYMKIIGKGSFGKVYQAMHKSENRLYAVKVLNKSQIKRRNEVRHIMSERNVLVINLRHPFLVGLNYSFQTKDKLYFVMDYLNGGELFFHLQREKRFPEARARFYGACLASAIGYLHDKDIIYRDLKPENLLLDDGGYLVITDFGLCKEGIQGKETTNTFCGTPEYLAPEVILKQPYDRTVDWWCLGSVLYEMLFGLPPFYSRDHKEMYDRIVHQPLRVSHAVSPGARDLLYGMLQKDRHRRLGSKKDIAEIKEHTFFLPINWDDLDNRKIPPPFVPKLKTETATPYVDKEFTDMPVGESVAGSAGLSASIGANDHHDDAFGGFTFVRPMVLEDITE